MNKLSIFGNGTARVPLGYRWVKRTGQGPNDRETWWEIVPDHAIRQMIVLWLKGSHNPTICATLERRIGNLKTWRSRLLKAMKAGWPLEDGLSDAALAMLNAEEWREQSKDVNRPRRGYAIAARRRHTKIVWQAKKEMKALRKAMRKRAKEGTRERHEIAVMWINVCQAAVGLTNTEVAKRAGYQLRHYRNVRSGREGSSKYGYGRVDPSFLIRVGGVFRDEAARLGITLPGKPFRAPGVSG